MCFKFLLSLSLLVGTAFAVDTDSTPGGSTDAVTEIHDTFIASLTETEMLYHVLIASFQKVYCKQKRNIIIKWEPEKLLFIRQVIHSSQVNDYLYQDFSEIYKAHRDSPKSLEVNFRHTIQRYKDNVEGKKISFEEARKKVKNTIRYFFETVTHTSLASISCVRYSSAPI